MEKERSDKVHANEAESFGISEADDAMISEEAARMKAEAALLDEYIDLESTGGSSTGLQFSARFRKEEEECFTDTA